jgi:hypothetical protein
MKNSRFALNSEQTLRLAELRNLLKEKLPVDQTLSWNPVAYNCLGRCGSTCSAYCVSSCRQVCESLCSVGCGTTCLGWWQP